MSGDTSHCVQLLNSFIHHGPNGRHFIMVFEILGVNFLELIKRYNYKGVPIPLVRKLARQCLIGLDYMHRMCKIIHTDFKPENVVIGLRDEEVAEIAKTGQLTTTKMFTQADEVKKLNMKVAGTLPNTNKDETKPDSTKAAGPKQASDRVWDIPEHLTAKQKKNLRKKLQRKRKKMEQSRVISDQADQDANAEEKPEEGKELDDINVQVETDN